MLERAGRVALDLLFPPQCAICREGGTVLCELCTATLPLAEAPRCIRCWTDIKHGSICAQCASAPPAFASARAPYAHDDAARKLVHLLKYEGLTSLGAPMAEQMIDAGRCPGADVVLPVPLHRGRERSRGYNQSALLGREVARGLGLPFEANGAKRIRATKPLVSAMSHDERREIVAGAFRAEPSRVEGRRILLVDDVMTTGATIDACARALVHAGAVEVHALTFVRA
jgi:ComF family protein